MARIKFDGSKYYRIDNVSIGRIDGMDSVDVWISMARNIIESMYGWYESMRWIKISRDDGTKYSIVDRKNKCLVVYDDGGGSNEVADVQVIVVVVS